MDFSSPFDFVILTVLCLATISAGLWALVYFSEDISRDARRFLEEADAEVAFLFDGDALVHNSQSAQQMVDQWSTTETAMTAFLADFGKRFPNVHTAIAQADETGKSTLKARDEKDTGTLAIDQWDGFTRFALKEDNDATNLDAFDIHTQAAQNAELNTLRSIAEDAPQLIWRTEPDGKIGWANEAYMQLARVMSAHGECAWPPIQVFSQVDRGPYPQDGSSKRTSVAVSEGANEHHKWFDVFSVPRDGGVVHFATDADLIVKAEVSQRDFVQTLTKTFAHLSIGLAIFDKNRQLALFNPALLELVSLPVDFLSQRPSLQTFLDRLREEQLMPEPKDYKSWRQQMSDLEAQAENGTYCETWTLPGGLTYRVTGRPHPNGAIGFLIEDISAEISLTRRFRSEIDLGRAVIDSVDEGVAVFSDTGVLTTTNQGYRDLWNADPESSFIEQTITDLSRNWQEQCKPNPIWDDVRDFVTKFEDRTEWFSDMETLDNQHLQCRCVPLPGGATMVAFRTMPRLLKGAQQQTGLQTSSPS